MLQVDFRDDFRELYAHVVQRKVPARTGRKECVTLLGELLKEVLLKAREDGVFRSLPLAERCEIGVEHFDGGYGWSEPVAGARDNPS